MTKDPIKSAESLPVVATSAPERIFLVIGMDCPGDARWDHLKEVTWCEDNIDGNGIAYVRADQLDALRDDRDSWQHQAESRTRDALRFADEAEALRFENENWKLVLWAVARELNCLPSTFSDGNTYVLKAAINLNAELAALKAGKEPT